MLAVVNAALVLLADHDLATSTLGVRVRRIHPRRPVRSRRRRARGARGPLHGGASVLARRLLDDTADVGAARAVADLLRARQRVPASAIPCTRTATPAAALLLDLLRNTPGTARTVHLADEVCREATARTGQAPNVDLALAALGATNAMADDAGEAVMATARIAGWLAHTIEEYGEAPLRYRPRARLRRSVTGRDAAHFGEVFLPVRFLASAARTIASNSSSVNGSTDSRLPFASRRHSASSGSVRSSSSETNGSARTGATVTQSQRGSSGLRVGS